MSLVLGGSRTRLILGGSVLGGDDLDGDADELLVATMMATLSLSLSLSLYVKCGLKVKQLWKWFYGLEGVFYGQSVKHCQFDHENSKMY